MGAVLTLSVHRSSVPRNANFAFHAVDRTGGESDLAQPVVAAVADLGEGCTVILHHPVLVYTENPYV
jgi:hypothetical protein